MGVAGLQAYAMWFLYNTGLITAFATRHLILAAAMAKMRAAIPLVALFTLLHVTGQIIQHYKDMENGVARYNWIEVLASEFQLFFAKVGLGWAEMNLSIVRVKETAKALLALDWARIDDIWNGGSEESRKLGTSRNIVGLGLGANPIASLGSLAMQGVNSIRDKNNPPVSIMPQTLTVTVVTDGKSQEYTTQLNSSGRYDPVMKVN
jgi:hypothetical protein